MTLDQLRIFVAVAEREHVTQAARDLHLTQSATSAAVAALEGRYATKLFDRVGRGIRLTEAGRVFLTEARAVLARAKAAELVLADLAGLRRGALALAASQTVGNYWLPGLMQHFHDLHPGIRLSLSIGNTEQVAAAVLEGSADLGFVEGDVAGDALAVEPVAQDELVLVVGLRHPWAKRKDVAAADLPATGWVSREPGSGTRAMFEMALRGFGLDVNAVAIRLELPSNEAVRSAVIAGTDATMLSRLVAGQALRAGTLIEVRLPLPNRPFSVVRHKERYITQAERALLALAAKHAKAIVEGFDPGL